MGERIRFREPEIKVVKKELSRAEKLLSGYYCIPEWEWSRYPYEVRLQEEIPGTEKPDNVFAMVAKFGTVPPRLSGEGISRVFFGICLQDENILQAASRDSSKVTLDALMLYILTHELIHIFRFANQFEDYLVPSPMRSAEEARVHKITRHILKKHADQAILPIIEVYENSL